MADQCVLSQSLDYDLQYYKGSEGLYNDCEFFTIKGFSMSRLISWRGWLECWSSYMRWVTSRDGSWMHLLTTNPCWWSPMIIDRVRVFGQKFLMVFCIVPLTWSSLWSPGVIGSGSLGYGSPFFLHKIHWNSLVEDSSVLKTSWITAQVKTPGTSWRRSLTSVTVCPDGLGALISWALLTVSSTSAWDIFLLQACLGAQE